MQKVTIETNFRHVTLSIAFSLIFLEGYKIVGYKKKTKWMGLKNISYTIVLEKIIDYPLEVKKAIEEERYEDIPNLQKQYTTEEDFYQQLNNEISKDLKLLPTLF